MGDLWSPLLPTGRLVLLNGDRGELRAFHHTLAQYAVHHHKGAVLWCDGEHGFNPYTFAELNLTSGFEADWGAERVLVKRCMTPFQWDTVLTKHLEEKLRDEAGAAFVLAAPFDALFSTDELLDWEQEDYVAYAVQHLREVARRHRVPILLSVDMAHWWRTRPILARITLDAVATRWTVRREREGWRAVEQGSGAAIEPPPSRRVTLLDFLPEPEKEAVARVPPRRKEPSYQARRTRIVHGNPR